jgi:hypothetical protein
VVYHVAVSLKEAFQKGVDLRVALRMGAARTEVRQSVLLQVGPDLRYHRHGSR